MTRALLAAASAIALLALGACNNDQSASNQTARAGIWAAGSSTVFPFTTRVAENFARTSGGAAPRVESLGTGGGIQAVPRGQREAGEHEPCDQRLRSDAERERQLAERAEVRRAGDDAAPLLLAAEPQRLSGNFSNLPDEPIRPDAAHETMLTMIAAPM